MIVFTRPPRGCREGVTVGLLSTSQTRQPLRLAASLRLQSGVVDAQKYSDKKALEEYGCNEEYIKSKVSITLTKGVLRSAYLRF